MGSPDEAASRVDRRSRCTRTNLSSGAMLAFLIASGSSVAATCPALDKTLLDKGFPDVAPWRVNSGGSTECSFSARTSSINFGFNHSIASSDAAARTAAAEMRQAVASTSVVTPMLSLGDDGIAYQPKKPNGQVDAKSMFFSGQRGTVGVSGYLNLDKPITEQQRILAANLISGTLGLASSPKALAKASQCRYLDAALVSRLLPAGDSSSIVPDASNCIVSAGGAVITVAITKDTRGWSGAQRMFKDDGCTVEAVADLGKSASIAHHCRKGNARAEVAFVTASRTVRVLFAPPAEPTAAQRETLVQLARFASQN